MTNKPIINIDANTPDKYMLKYRLLVHHHSRTSARLEFTNQDCNTIDLYDLFIGHKI